MTWRTAGTIEYRGFVRRVAWNPRTGEVERTYGKEKVIVQAGTSRSVGKATSEEEAKRLALADLVGTFYEEGA